MCFHSPTAAPACLLLRRCPAPACRVKEQRGIRLVVEGSIRSADGATVLASCEATLADLTQFI